MFTSRLLNELNRRDFSNSVQAAQRFLAEAARQNFVLREQFVSLRNRAAFRRQACRRVDKTANPRLYRNCGETGFQLRSPGAHVYAVRTRVRARARAYNIAAVTSRASGYRSTIEHIIRRPVID